MPRGRKKASELKGGRTPYFIADLSTRNPLFDATKYIGKEINNEEYILLKKLLKEENAFERTKILITTHLNYGSNMLKQNLREEEFLILNNLRETIEESLDRLI